MVVESLSVTVGSSGSRRAVVQRQSHPDDNDRMMDEEVERRFRMPNYASVQERLPLQLNYDFPLHNFIVVTLGKYCMLIYHT